MTKKVTEPKAGRKPSKLSPSEWKAGTAGLRGLGKCWAGHRDKQPLQPKTSRYAKSNNPATWATWEEAAAFYERTQKDLLAGAGLMLDAGLLCLDLDACFDEQGKLKPWAVAILAAIPDHWREVSLSGKGLHVLARGNLPTLVPGATRTKARVRMAGAEEKDAVEFFSTPHFVTVSGRVHEGRGTLREAGEEFLAVLGSTGLLGALQKPVGAPEGEVPAPGTQEAREALEEATAALQAIDPDTDRDTWLKCGMALKSHFGAAGWAPWYEWSSKGGKFVAGDCEKRWASFGGTGVGIGTLYHYAKEAGYIITPKRSSAEEDFADFKVEVDAEGEPLPVEGEPDAPEKFEEGHATQWNACGLHITTKGTAKNPTFSPSEGDANIGLYLTNHKRWKGRLRWNERTMEIEVDGTTEALDLHRLAIELVWFMGWRRSPSEESVLRAATAVAKLRSYDPVRDWLNGLQWDGGGRLDRICEDLGLEDDALSRRSVKRWFIGAVARAMRPGVEMQNMLVLHGDQGKKKSALFKALAVREEWYSESTVEMGTKDGQLMLLGPWIVEVAELSGMTRADVDKVKGFISERTSKFRAPYGRKTESWPRRVVFGGTTNDEEFLRDGTGSRRFWLVSVKDEIKVGYLTEEVVAQLWAEAVVAYKSGERWWDEGVEVREVSAKNSEHYLSSGLDALVVAVLAGVQGAGTTSEFVLRELVTNHRVNPGTSRNLVGQSMTRAGWTKTRIRPMGKGGPQPTIFRRPEVKDPNVDPGAREALKLAFKRTLPGGEFVEEPEGAPGEEKGR